MWKKIAPMLIVLSVALNVAFISVWAFQAVRSHWPAGYIKDDSKVWCPLHRHLNVTDEQWRQIEPRLEAFQRDAQTLCQDINRLRGEMIGLIAADEPDRQAIAAKQNEIRAGQRRMQQLVVEHLLAEKQVLTVEQQKELFNMIRRRSACAGPARMMGLPSTSVGRHAAKRNQHEDLTADQE